MACNSCVGSVFKEKLGRCKQCMVVNFVLLIVAIGFYFFADMSGWLAVQQIAFLIFMWGVTGLMCLHLIAWCVYRFQN